MTVSLSGPLLGLAIAVGHDADSVERPPPLGIDGTAQSLEERVGRSPSDVDAQFQLGLMAIEQGAYRDAIARFRAALLHSPDAPRIRLELARALFLAKDYDNALRQFRRAQAGDLPPGVMANVGQFVEAIRRQRIWSYQFGIAIAPDSNINGGSSSRETILFGLPFELGAEARRKSGIGLAANAEVEYLPRLSDTTRVRLAAGLRRRDYAGTRFDDMTITAQAGPSFEFGALEIGVAGTALARWYGARPYQRALGARVVAAAYPGKRIAVSVDLAAQRLRYPASRFHDGHSVSAFAGVTRLLGPSSSASVQVGFARHKARVADLSNRAALVTLGYARELKGGFAISIEPTLAVTRYDAPDPLFAIRRRDSTRELRLSLVNRRWMWWRFSPAITYTYSRRRSSIDLFDNGQSRLELGLSSAF